MYVFKKEFQCQWCRMTIGVLKPLSETDYRSIIFRQQPFLEKLTPYLGKENKQLYTGVVTAMLVWCFIPRG